MDDNICKCTWKPLWHRAAPDSNTEVRESSITEYSTDCPHHRDIAVALKLARKALQQK